MKVKKYRASSMPEVMKLVRKDFGTDAVILQSKEVKSGGVFGLFKKNMIEVIAGYDPEPVPAAAKKVPGERKVIQPKQSESTKKEAGSYSKEMEQIYKLLAAQSRQMQFQLHPNQQLIYDFLIEQEVLPEIALALVQKASKEGESSGDAENRLKHSVAQQIQAKINELNLGFHFSKRIIQFVGPTGVGKTTTIAKIAAKMQLQESKRIAFITLDTYRIAAVEQLKTYAKILHIPVEVAYTKEQYHQFIERFADYDVIMVDTAGRNYRDDAYLKDLTGWINPAYVTNYLVLSMTTKPKDLLDIYGRFESVGIEGIILTKLDETKQYGNILNLVSAYSELRIGYLTNGQDVPEDMIVPTEEQLIRYIMGDHR